MLQMLHTSNFHPVAATFSNLGYHKDSMNKIFLQVQKHKTSQ